MGNKHGEEQGNEMGLTVSAGPRCERRERDGKVLGFDDVHDGRRSDEADVRVRTVESDVWRADRSPRCPWSAVTGGVPAGGPRRARGARRERSQRDLQRGSSPFDGAASSTRQVAETTCSGP
jgi:hypothetical protein